MDLATNHPQPNIIGRHPNGTALHRQLEGFTVEQAVFIVYRNAPHVEPLPGVIRELFITPNGPTACVEAEEKPGCFTTRWVSLASLRPRQAAMRSDALKRNLGGGDLTQLIRSLSL